ncbi:max-binding protein MNT-like [Onthophagus taurus]|uniref:max-binding protein MNT-like n=1 Tax=Onthophagus taurus TaxID=166361 RepID=UPI0039BEB6FA
MNVETLLEAAKFLELQEERQRQREQATIKLTHPLQINQHNHNNQIHHQPISITTLQLSPHQLHQNQTTQPPPQPQQQQLPPTITTTAIPTLIRTSTKQESSLPSTSPRQINNSFDIINPLVIDDSGEPKRKQPPIPFRTGTREVHNKLEKDRRAHLKECFDALKKQLPRAQDERKSSNLSILHSALRYIQSLKKKERDLEHEMESLARQKIANQQRLAVLRKDSGVSIDGLDMTGLLPEVMGSPDVVEKMDDEDEKVMEKLPLPRMSVNNQNNGIKEGSSMQALSVVPVTYPMSQVVLQKVLVPKNLSELPLVSSPATAVAHFITPQPLSGKVVPLVNAQYVVKPVVVVSTPSRPS